MQLQPQPEFTSCRHSGRELNGNVRVVEESREETTKGSFSDTRGLHSRSRKARTRPGTRNAAKIVKREEKEFGGNRVVAFGD
jgi:hypothetical protein